MLTFSLFIVTSFSNTDAFAELYYSKSTFQAPFSLSFIRVQRSSHTPFFSSLLRILGVRIMPLPIFDDHRIKSYFGTKANLGRTKIDESYQAGHRCDTDLLEGEYFFPDPSQ